MESTEPLENESITENNGTLMELVYINHGFQRRWNNELKEISIMRTGVIPEMTYEERSLLN